MRPSKRLERIPPYAFAQLERKIADKRAAGVDVISLGIGDPDRPTPALIVEAMQEAVSEPETHQYPTNRGRDDFRGAVRDFYERRFDVKLDPDSEIMPALGAKEVTLAPARRPARGGLDRRGRRRRRALGCGDPRPTRHLGEWRRTSPGRMAHPVVGPWRRAAGSPAGPLPGLGLLRTRASAPA